MAEAAANKETEKPAGGKLKRLLMPLLMLVIGAAGGVAAGMFIPDLLNPPEAADQPAPKKPQRTPTEYIPIDNNFTANLKDTGRYVQVKIAVSTQGGQPVKDALEQHKLAIISLIVGILSDTTEADLLAPGGREQLSKKIQHAINELLVRKSGIGGVDDVLLTSFVMQ